MRRALPICAALALGLAALSLLLPYRPVYDPWGWLVWGRELAHLDLATAAGPSWKPLPALLCAPLSLLGAAAPHAWLLIARAGWLLAPLLAALLAWRVAGGQTGSWRAVAASIAAASVALTWDAFTPPLRQFTGGLSEPLLVALVLGTIAAALERRPRVALWLGALACLLRPECWPFLVAWAWHETGHDPGLRRPAVGVVLLVPLAWFLPDLLGAGNPLEGSETARQGGIELSEIGQVGGRALLAPLAAVWIGVGFLLLRWRAERRSEPLLATLLLGAAAWVGLVAAMAVLGYAGLPRFLAPASAVISVVGAVGVARACAAAFAPGVRSRALKALATASLLLAAFGVGLRASHLPGDLDTIERQTRSQEALAALASQFGRDRLLACGGTVRVTQLLAQTALAWELDAPIESIRVIRRPRYGIALSTRPLPGGRSLAREGAWRATRLPC